MLASWEFPPSAGALDWVGNAATSRGDGTRRRPTPSRGRERFPRPPAAPGRGALGETSRSAFGETAEPPSCCPPPFSWREETLPPRCGCFNWSESLVRAGHWEALLDDFQRLTALPGLSLAAAAQERCRWRAGRKGEEQSLRPRGRYPGKAGWGLPGGRAARRVFLPPRRDGVWGVGPLSGAGGGCG